MYQTGSPATLEKRIHQFIISGQPNTGDLNFYITEASGYVGSGLNRYQTGIWQREINKKLFNFYSGKVTF